MKALQQTEQMHDALLAAIITHSTCTTSVTRNRSCSRYNQHAQKLPLSAYIVKCSLSETEAFAAEWLVKTQSEGCAVIKHCLTAARSRH